ncbi:MAG: amino acid ABC transporter permease [Clostridia bacterium]|nr:amino acid ABC transporter permease [Clostridia bacterium]
MNVDMKLLWDKFIDALIEKNGYKVVLEGLYNTIQIAVLGLLIGIVIGTLIAIVRVMPKYKVLPRILDKICGCYVELFRGTPMMVQLLISYNVLLPLMGISVDSGLPVAIVVFGLNSGAYVSEIMRSGINSVDIGQMEAGRAMGLTYTTTMMKIVVPQAVKNILPTLGNEFIVLVKETSITGYVATIDLTRAFTKLAGPSMSYIIPYLMLGVSYLVIVLLISWGVRSLEKRLKKSER